MFLLNATGGAGGSGGNVDITENVYGGDGGDGGIGLYLAPTSATQFLIDAAMTGGAGGTGGYTQGGPAGNGGNGGAGVVLTGGSNLTIQNTSSAVGGAGGIIGSGGQAGNGGTAGNGGAGIIVTQATTLSEPYTVSVEAGGAVTGGQGGTSDTVQGGGGAGIWIAPPGATVPGGTLVVTVGGKVTGGASLGGTGGGGGAGIYSSGGLDSLIIVRGTVQGGASRLLSGASGATASAGVAGSNISLVILEGHVVKGATEFGVQPAAVAFTGGTNTLELSGSGGLDGAAIGRDGDTFELSGSGTESITLSTSLTPSTQTLLGFSNLVKSGRSSWTLGGALDFTTMTVEGGQLTLASGTSLGGGSMTVASGGTLDVGNLVSTGPASFLSLTVNSGGTLAIGDVASAPSTSFSVADTLSIGGTLRATLTDQGVAPILAQGAVLQDGFTVEVAADSVLRTGLYDLIIAGPGGISGATSPVSWTVDDYTLTLLTTASRLQLQVSTPTLRWNGNNTSGPPQGGSGTWSAGPTTNWTSPNGTENLAWNSNTAVFGSSNGGIVTIDNSAGAVSVQAMRFERNDYVIAGDALTLAGPNGTTVVTVGEGGTTAIIASNLIGNSLTVSGPGTLTLTGTNTYTGGTTISAGATLVLGEGGAGGAVLGDIVTYGTLGLIGGLPTVANTISGTGGVEVGSNGIPLPVPVTLAGSNTYSGTTLVSGNPLILANASALGSTAGGTRVEAGGSLALTGSIAIGNEALTLNSIGDDIALGGLLSLSGDNSWAGPISLPTSLGVTGIFFAAPGTSLTLSGSISGTQGVTVYGGGLIALTGTNSFTGGVTVASGTLQVGGDAALGAASGGLTLTGSTFSVTSGFTTARTVTLGTGGGTISVAAGQTLTLSGSVEGTGGLVVSGAGTLSLAGAAVQASPVSVASGATLAGYGAITDAVSIAGGATLAGGYAAADNTAGTALQTGALTLAAGATTLLAFGANANAGVADVNGALALAGTLTLEGAPANGTGVYRVFTYSGGPLTGTLSVSGTPDTYLATLQTDVPGQVNLLLADATAIQRWAANGSAAGGSGTWSSAGLTWLDVADASTAWGGTFGIFAGPSGTVTIAGAQSFEKLEFVSDGYELVSDGADGSGLALTGKGTLWVEGHDITATISASISGTGELVKVGAGTLVLAGANSYTGGTRISGGFISVASDAALGAGGLTLANGGLIGTADVTLSQAVTLAGTGTFAPQNGVTLTLGTSITGTGTLNKEGGGTLVLSAANRFTGATVIRAGTVVAQGGSALPDTSDVTIAAGGLLALEVSETIGTLSGAGAVQLGTATLTLAGPGSTSFAGVISGDGALAMTGAQTLVLTGANSYTGGTTLVSTATLVVGAGGASGSITGPVANNGTLSFVRSDDVTFAGAISGSGTVYQLGAGTLTLTGANSFTGGLVVGAGTLEVASDGALGAASGALSLNAATLRTTSSFTSARAIGFTGLNTVEVASGTVLDLGGALSGSGGFEKTGTGTLALSGAGTLGAGVTISAGTLALQGSALTAPTLSVESGARLSGFGQIAATITVDAGGTLLGGSAAAGDAAAGGLSTGALTLASSATSVLELGARTNAGIAHVTGNLSLAGTLDVTGTPAHGAGLYHVFSYTGTLSGDVTLGTTPAGYTATLDTSTAQTVSVLLSDASPFQFWTVNKGASFGGSGTWTSTSRTWDEAAAGVVLPWGGEVGIFTGTAGTVTIVGQQAFQKLQFASTGYLLKADAATAGSGLTFTSGGTLWVEGALTQAQIDAPISGKGGLTKVGAGLLLLGGVNAFEGGLTVAGGFVAAASDASLGRATGKITLADGGLWAVADISTSRTFVLTGTAMLGAEAGRTLTVNGNVTEQGDLLKLGAGTVILAGVGTYAGETRVAAGTLALWSGAAMADLSGVTVDSAGTLRLGASETIGSLAGAGAVDLASYVLTTGGNDRDTTFSGVLSGSGGLTKTGSGTLVLSGANSFTGSTTIAEGTLQIGEGGTRGALAGTVLNDSLLVFNRSDAVTFAGSIFGTGAVRQSGSGTLTLSGQNIFSGGVEVAAGTLAVASDAALGAAAGTVALGGGTFSATASFTSARSFSLDLGSGTIAVAAGQTLTLTSGIVGLAGLTLAGPGTLELSSAVSSYEGNTLLAGGTLLLNGASLTATDVTVAAGATLTGFGSITDGVSVLSDGVLSGGVSSRDNPQGAALQIGGDLTLAASALSVLAVGGGANAGIATSATLALGGTLDITGTPETGAGIYRVFTYTSGVSGSLAIGTTPSGFSATLERSIPGQVNVLLADASPLLGWTANGTDFGGSGTWSSSGTTWNELAYDTLVPWNGQIGIFAGTAGTVTVAGSQAFQKLEFVTDGYEIAADSTPGSGLTFSGGGTIWVEGHDVTTLVQAPISGTGGLEKVGAGTLVLSGTNLYEGGTRIKGGVLQIASDAALGAASGGVTLAGGALSVVGSLTLTRAVTLEARGTFEVSGSDTLTLAGTVSGAGGLRKEGTGTLVLAAANAYQGTSVIEGGTLLAGVAGAVPAGSDVTVQSGATLRLGADQSIGALAGRGHVDLSSFALTTHTGTDSLFAGNLSGSGSLALTGKGTLTLTGDNSYTGGTTIIGGSLRIGGGGTSGSLTGNVSNAGALVFDRSDDVVFSGSISGSGFVAQLGTGTLTLTGENSFSGGVGVLFGTLAVSSAANLGDGSAAIQLAGGGRLAATASFTLAAPVTLILGGGISVADGASLKLTGGMSGDGGFTKEGGGTLVLTSDLRHSGGVVIEAGTLQVGEGGAAGWIAGSITNNAALVYDLKTDYTLSALTGTGSLTVRGGGRATFAASGFTGQVAVSNAHLVLASGIVSSAGFTIGSDGVLSGAGQVASLTVRQGGLVSPGYSPGTLHITGNLTLDAGATYAAEIAPQGVSDLLAAQGTATIAGATLVVSSGQGTYRAGTTYTILTADGGLTGQFADVRSLHPSTFLDVRTSYDANSVYLTLARNGTHFPDVAQTVNQAETAYGVEHLGPGNAVYDAVLGLSAVEAPAAFDALSGEAYASVSSVLQQQSIYVRDAVSGRLRQALTAPGVSPLAYGPGPVKAQLAEGYTPTLWAQGYGGWGNSWSNGNAASISNTIGGFLMGADVSVAENARAGLFGGYSRSTFDVDGRSSSGSANNYNLGLYAGAQFGAVALRGGAAYTWHDLSMSRSVVFPGFAESLKGNDTTGTAQVFGEIGYDVEVGAIAFEPFLGLAYVNVSGASLGEEGGAAALSVSTDDMSTVYSTLGVRLATTVEVGGRTLTPYATLGWQHAFGDVTPSSTMQFAGGLTPFTVSGVPVAEDALLLEAGLSYALSPNAQIGATYAGQLSGDASQNTFTAQFSLKF
ncbi:autotransporter-associated beta strand repeat-containing protein [Ancylobacter sp.]|uniref:autotransporter-associated beta strand repeat-containing protein n=1 Tax=Ancylobacter sp. TaxID=1872567 RepID=UPI003C7ACBF6